MGWTGWSVSAPHQTPPFTWIMWCEPKVASVVSFSLSVPPHPPPHPSLLEPPLAGRTLSPGWSGSCWDCWAAGEGGRNGWMDGGRRGLHRPGEHCQQPPTSPITLHTILPSYPLSLLTLPHIQTDSPPAVCVCICVCALVIYLHTGFSGGWTCQKKRETVHVCVFVVVSERFLVCTACVCVGV